jgi:triacylglycerol esterase/lipase EstA (alpha/beta hydrolase family)
MSDMRLFLAAALLGAFTLAACAPTTAVRFDAADAWPGAPAAPATRTSCGGCGEPACTLDQQLTRLLPACQPGLEELYLPLGSCFPAEHLARPTTHAWPGTEVTPGPRSVFLVHGMTGSVASFSPSARHLAAALRASGHHVFNVDYNADSDIPRGLALYELRNGQWQPAGLYGKSLSGTTLTITEVAASLRDAILSNAAMPNVAIVGHSMGGLVARTLVQNHYDELRLAGTRVAEVVTLGSPHTGGGFGIPEITTGRGVQGVTMCWGLRAISDPQLRRFSYQACMMERWHEQREALPTGQFIDNRDFPQVRWLTVAGGGQTILNRSVHAAYQEIQGWLNANFALNLDLAIAEVDSDSMVAVSSAFGIQADGCFPHRQDEPDAGLAPLVPDGEPTTARLRRSIRTLNDQPLYSAECFLPSRGDPGDRRYRPLSRLDGTDHQYEGREEVIAFVDAMLAPARRPR